MIRPAESVPGILHGYQLVFKQPGLPFREPAFASVEPGTSSDGSAAGAEVLDAPVAGSPGRLTRARLRQQQQQENGATNGTAVAAAASAPAQLERPDVHGVLHRITPSEWAYVLETEGGSNNQSEEHGYKGEVLRADWLLLCATQDAGHARCSAGARWDDLLSLTLCRARSLRLACLCLLAALLHSAGRALLARGLCLLPSPLLLPPLLPQSSPACFHALCCSAGGGGGSL